MSNWITATLCKYASVGDVIEISIKGSSRDELVQGVYVESNEHGVVVHSPTGICAFNAEDVRSFNVLQRGSASSAPEVLVTASANQSTRPDISQQSPATATLIDATALEPVASTFPQISDQLATGPAPAKPEAMIQTPTQDSATPIESQLAAADGDPEDQLGARGIPDFAFDEFVDQRVSVTLPVLQFDVEGLNVQEKQELVRWKNKYEYAEKVQEPSRIRQFLGEMTRFADRLRVAEVYTLVGQLALRVGEKTAAKDALKKSVGVGSSEGALVLAQVYADESDWKAAAEFFCRTCVLRNSEMDVEIVAALGRCLAHLEDRELPGLSSIVKPYLPERTQRTVRKVLALALREANPSAAESAFHGDLDQARQRALQSRVFEELKPLETPSTSPTESKSGAQPRVMIPHTRGVTYAPGEELRGHVSAFRQDRRYGFLIEEVYQQTFFFRQEDVSDHALSDQLWHQKLGQIVTFMPRPRFTESAKFDMATKVRMMPSDGAAALPPSDKHARTRDLRHLPQTQSVYRDAKLAELDGDLDLAQRLYHEVINEGGRYHLSAVKDLARMLDSLGKSDEAVGLLDRYRADFPAEDLRSVDNQKATHLIKAKRYLEAADVYHSLHNAVGYSDKLTLMKNEARCLILNGDFDKALELLSGLRRLFPHAAASTDQLVLKARQAQKQGLSSADEEELLKLAGSLSGLSRFSEFILSSCKLTGVDDRAKARGWFLREDFDKVQRTLDRLTGRVPEQKAELALSLAAMCWKSPVGAGHRSMHDYLRKSLMFRGEAAISVGLHRDTARCFLNEALMLDFQTSERGDNFPLTYLLSTYLSDVPPPGALIAKDGRFYVDTVLRRFETDPNGWKAFLKDLPYYALLSDVVHRDLEQHLDKLRMSDFLPDKTTTDEARQQEKQRLRAEGAELHGLAYAEQTLGVSWLEDGSLTLHRCSSNSRFALDRERLSQLSGVSAEAARNWDEKEYVERELRHGRLSAQLGGLINDIKNQPTTLSVEYLLPFCERLADALNADWNHYRSAAKPVIELTNVLRDGYYIPDDNNVLTVKLDLSSAEGSAPIEGASIRLMGDDGLRLREPCDSPEVLRGGQRREITLLLEPTQKHLDDQAFTLIAMLEYRRRSDGEPDAHEFTIPVRTGRRESFSQIPNPYMNYAGGNVVADPGMFFGRRELLNRIMEQSCLGPVGQCFVLYGQKRSGKSSVLKQLEKQISQPVLSVPASVGVLEAKDSEKNFVQLLLNELSRKLRRGVGIDPPDWPTAERIAELPVESFRDGVSLAVDSLANSGWKQPRIVFLVDEFSYLYEYIREGIISPSFMRQWKSLLQLQTFSAVLVGQDSMPRFMDAYRNEFGVTKRERISYLTQDEARQLAEQPIMLGEQSRYRGKSLHRLLQMTAGSPFFMQIVCDRLVRHLNEQKAPFITEADLYEVEQQLVLKESRLDEDIFDPLITVASESVAEAHREVYLNLLTAIGNASTANAGARLSDLPEIENRDALLKDMQDRDVITTDAAQRISIRVGLFAEWLRCNMSPSTK